MSDVEQEDEGLVENPEPEADAPPEDDAPPESEAEAGVEYQAAGAPGHSADIGETVDNQRKDGTPSTGTGDIQITSNQQQPDANDDNSLAEGDQNHQRPSRSVENENIIEHEEDGGATASNELEDNLEAEDEQYYHGNVEVNFAGAEWSLEPEENSHHLPGFGAEGECADGSVYHEDTAEAEQGSTGCVAAHHRTESSCHLEDSSVGECGAVHGVESQAFLEAEADGASASVSEAAGNMENVFDLEEDSNCIADEENEPTESDQDLGLNSASNISSACGERTDELYRDTHTAVESASANGENYTVNQLLEEDPDRPTVESTVKDEKIPEDELNVVAPVEVKSNETLSCQPECDQSAIGNYQNESSQNPEGMSEAKECAVNQGVSDEQCSVSETEATSENVNKSVSSSPGDKQASSGEQIESDTSSSSSNVGRQASQVDSASSRNPPETHIQLDLSKEKGAIPKHSNPRSIASSETKPLFSKGKQENSTDQHKQPPDKESHTDNQRLEQSETNGKSTKPEQCANIDSEDELLSELDATLKSATSNSTNLGKGQENCAISTGDTSVEDEEISCEQCLRNNLRCSLGKKKSAHREGSSHIPETRDLKRQFHQAKQLLLDRECEISRLKDDLKDCKERIETLSQDRDSCQKEMECLKHQNSDDLYIPQIKELEYTIAQQQNEVRSYKDKLSSHDGAAKRAIATLQQEMKLRIDQVTKMYEDATREKDSMVVKYAQAEHKNLEFQKQAERAEAKLREMEKERDVFMVKMRAIKDHRTKVGAELDAKMAELNNTNKELDKQRELLSSADVRVKWAQNKLKAELDAHKETKVQLEKVNIKLKEAKEETQQIRQDCQAIIKTYQESEEVKSNSLDKELKQKETELLVNLQEKNSFELAHVKTQRELEHVRGELRGTQAKCASLKENITSLETEKDDLTSTMNKYTDIIQKQKKEVQELRERIETLVQYRSDFARAQDMIKNLDAEIAELKISNKDLVAETEACRRRETDKLELTEKLSRKNAELQSENTTLSNKILNLTGELQATKMDSQSVDTKVKELTDALAIEQKLRREETQGLTTRLAGKSKAVEDLTRKLDEEKDEIKIIKRKHTNNVKDLTRQLQQVRRKLENYEASTNGEKDTISMGSRTSSNGSLNTINIAEQTNTQVVQPSISTQNNQMVNSVHRNPPPEQEYHVITEQVEVDKQTLIERIVKLQRAMARKNEKLEFMEDHITQLVDEIQKKNKIIQSYVLKEETGTMTSNSRDLAKAEISRKHSIMGSVYSSHNNDGSMTLDLSLEINRKLQAVLEDALLKNMTLKESLDTLGQEIARLSQENRKLQLQMQSKGRVRGNPAHR